MELGAAHSSLSLHCAKMEGFAFLGFSGYDMLALFLFGIMMTWWCFRRLSRKNLPPGPFNWPVIGCLHLLGSLPHVSLDKLSRKYGDIFYLRLGTVGFIIISSSQAAKQVYRNHGLEFASKMATIAGKYFGNNHNGIVFSGYTADLKRFRKVVNTHLLSATRLKAYEQVREEEQLSLARSVLQEGTGSSSSPMQVRSKLHVMNMNIITYMLFGERYYGSTMSEGVNPDEFVEVITESLRLSGVFNISDFIPAIRWMDVQGMEKRFKVLMSQVNEHLMSILQKRRRNSSRIKGDNSTGEPTSFIDMLISLDSTEDKIADISKVCLIFDMLLGAVDTSALSTEWALAELIRHPSKLDKARKEIDDLVGNGRLVRESDLIHLPYIEAVAKETLRLHPLAPLALPKILKAPLRLGGYEIPAGTAAFVNFYSVGMDGNHWKDPTEFKPERFLESSIDVFGQDYNLLPFGSGRRMCPGAKLGFDTLQLALATLVQGFDWSLQQGKDPSAMNMEETYGLVCHKTEPLVATAKPRLPAHSYGL